MKWISCGLRAGPVLSGDITQIAFAIKLFELGQAEVREGGAYAGETSYSAGDVFRIAVESGLVKYYKNGSQVTTSTHPSASYPLAVSASFYSLNATISNAVLYMPNSVPTSYAAVSDREPRVPPALPDVSGGAGTWFKDPTFDTWICRVTDAATDPSMNTPVTGPNGNGNMFVTTSASEEVNLSKDGGNLGSNYLRFYVRTLGGLVYVYRLNKATSPPTVTRE